MFVDNIIVFIYLTRREVICLYTS